VNALLAVRAVVANLLLLAVAGFGMLVATASLMLAVAVGDLDGWGDLVRDGMFTVAGFAGLAVVPALVALWLRPRQPVASGVVATGVGALAVCLCGPHADGGGGAMVAALGGLLLVACAVPLGPSRAGDRFGA
jgi:hypothetical protein